MACPFKVGMRTPALWCSPSSWGYGVPRFRGACRVSDIDSHASMWPVAFGIRTPTLQCGASSWGCQRRGFGLAHELGIRSAMLWCGPLG